MARLEPANLSKPAQTGFTPAHDMSDADFRFFADLIYRQGGIVMSDSKRQLVRSRLTRRLKELRLPDFASYRDLLSDPRQATAELEGFINALTTNLTSFFRERHHFDLLADSVLPALLTAGRSDKTLRIWSAGCSSGEEIYTIGMTLQPRLPPGWRMLLLATDIDTEKVDEAAAGIYSSDRIKDLPREVVKQWFMRGSGEREGWVRVRPELRELVTARPLNLLGPWPFKHPFDVIFCRNVVIYFDRDTQATLFDRFANQLIPNGHLFIGHSETLAKKCDRFELCGPTYYRKIR